MRQIDLSRTLPKTRRNVGKEAEAKTAAHAAVVRQVAAPRIGAAIWHIEIVGLVCCGLKRRVRSSAGPGRFKERVT